MTSELASRTRLLAAAIAAKLEEAPAESRARTFYDDLRGTDLPYLAALLDDPGEAFHRLFDVLFTLGGASLPLTIGFTMHAYMFSAIATAPIPGEPFATRRRRFVDDVLARRLLVGVSSFGNNLRREGERAEDVVAEEEGEGFVANGPKRFNSMASEADYLAFTAQLPSGALGFFAGEVKGAPGVRWSPPLFDGPMSGADTRSLAFERYTCPADALLSADDELTSFLCTWSTSWFEALASGSYLGGAARAIEEVRTFAERTRTRDGAPLAELDGVIVEAGRLLIELKSALALASTFGVLTTKACRLARSGDAASEEIAQAMNELSECASLIKHRATRSAELIVTEARRMIGTRSLGAGHPLRHLSAEIQFGPLHPTLAADLERGLGRALFSGDHASFALTALTDPAR